MNKVRDHKPEWLKIRVKDTEKQRMVETLMSQMSLNTVCDEAMCPNRMECFGNKTATFMIMGRFCTRNCSFCNVEHHPPSDLDLQESEHLVEAVMALGLEHVVITSVTRDDLDDGGASQFAKVIELLRLNHPELVIEVLIPDFLGNKSAIKKVVDACPDIIGHNIETVPSLYDEVRPQAIYKRSLDVIKYVNELNPAIMTKSGIMMGLGESLDEVSCVLDDLREVACDFLTVGQYLAPSVEHHVVVEYIEPDTFKSIERLAYEKGFRYVASAPLVRSSYKAQEAYRKHT